MKIYPRLKKQKMFWVLSAIAIILTIAFLYKIAAFQNYFAEWKKLPPLPKGETAQDFTDVLVRNKINVRTDQGHYYSCHYEAEETCWESIPREVNNPISTNPGIGLPWLPQGTRKMVSTYQGSYSSSTGVFVLVAIIQKDGQVAIWTENIDDMSSFFVFVINFCCGALFLIVGLLFFAVIRKVKSDLQRGINELNSSEVDT